MRVNEEDLKKLIIERGNLAVKERENVEKIADEISRNGFENIFFAGSGGSITTICHFPRIIRKLSNIPAYAEEAAELMYSNYNCLNEKSLVVIMAKTGTMKESVELSEYCKAHNIPTVGFVMIDNTPVANNVTYKILIDKFSEPIRFLPMYYLIFRLLKNHGDFEDYDEFANEIANIPAGLVEVIDNFKDEAKEYARKYFNEDFQLWIYSGINYGEALKYSADVAEELFRQKTQAMNSGEFFHGCLEIVQDDMSIVMLMSEDESRPMDERCLKFLQKYASGKLWVIDTAKFEMKGISKKFRKYISPIILTVCIEDLFAEYMMDFSGKNHSTRRYYQIVEY
ncbi:MAG: SIS domain-containing protein [Firmicutes bacterium]|nr:SIS domain-containing protein [Candidatus Colivicinus equi]